MAAVVPLGVVAFAPRERVRALLQRLPRRRLHTMVVADVAAFRVALRSGVVDAVVVDLGGGDAAWQVAALAPELPTAAWLGVAPWRAADAPAIDRAARLGLGDVLADGIDDAVLASRLTDGAFTTRFASAFAAAPGSFRLERDVQRSAWQVIVQHAGRPVTTEVVAGAVGVSREHLSRAFAAGGAPNLKRVIDFVRLSSAAALAKNPLYDTGDVARVLQFASASHLATATRRIVGLTPSSLARLRPAELAEHFIRGHARSRG